MTTHQVPNRHAAAFSRDSGASPSVPAATPFSWGTGSATHSRTDARLEPQPGMDPEQSPTDPTELLTGLRRIRTEMSALPPLDHRPVGDQIVQDLDEVIQRARLAASNVVNGLELPPPETRGASVREAVHLPSGPDYPAPTYR